MPISMGTPATVAYAIAFGITTAAVVSPARISRRNQVGWYSDNQSSSGGRKLTHAAFAGGPHGDMGPRGNAAKVALAGLSFPARVRSETCRSSGGRHAKR